MLKEVKMNKKIIIAMILGIFLITSGILVSAAMQNKEEVQERVPKSATCEMQDGSGQCGINSCNGQCGNANSCQGQCGGSCGQSSCGCNRQN